MSNFLKKLESENFRLRFLKFSEIDSWSVLENYTRIKSFILNGQFEIASTKWYRMYLYIVELLQTVKPIDLGRLLAIEPMSGRCRPFLDHSQGGYLRTDFGLYLRDPGAANKVVPAIMWMLKLYGFNPEDAYLVVELTPDCANDYSDGIIEAEKQELYDYLKRVFVEADRFYDMAIRGIDELNHSLRYYSTTTYNNLYLLNASDFDRYANDAIERQLDRENNTFTRSELSKAVLWLSDVRFRQGDYLNPTHKTFGDDYIVDGDKRIKVTFNTHFMEGNNHE